MASHGSPDTRRPCEERSDAASALCYVTSENEYWSKLGQEMRGVPKVSAEKEHLNGGTKSGRVPGIGVLPTDLPLEMLGQATIDGRFALLHSLRQSRPLTLAQG